MDPFEPQELMKTQGNSIELKLNQTKLSYKRQKTQKGGITEDQQ